MPGLVCDLKEHNGSLQIPHIIFAVGCSYVFSIFSTSWSDSFRSLSKGQSDRKNLKGKKGEKKRPQRQKPTDLKWAVCVFQANRFLNLSAITILRLRC